MRFATQLKPRCVIEGKLTAPNISPTVDLGKFNSVVFADRLINWYVANRRPMRWHGADAYSVWVSEIMLQQTQAATVTEYYDRFMHSFPTVHALAAASQEVVLAHWSGLGYYARARNLHEAAKIVVARHGGNVPNSLNELLNLPGIGRYTAGAILSIAYNQPVPLVDANVARVISRLFTLNELPTSREGNKNLWAITSHLVPLQHPGLFNQGLMELGATVCTPTAPDCNKCPVTSLCGAHATVDPSQWPTKTARKKFVQQIHCSVVVRQPDGGVYLVRRPSRGRWGGLWEFPRVECKQDETPCEAAERAARQLLNVPITDVTMVTAVKHTVTHHNITLYCCTAQALEVPVTGEGIHLVSVESLPDYPLAAPQVLLRNQILCPAKFEIQQALTL